MPYNRVFADVFSAPRSTLYVQLVRRSSLITQRSSLKGVCQDAKPVRANSRGFLNPWNNDKKKKWRLQRRGRTVRVADSRLYRRHEYKDTKTEGLKAPGYSCSRLSDVFSFIIFV